MTSRADIFGAVSGRGSHGPDTGSPQRSRLDVRSIRLDHITPDPEQPRQTFDEAKLDELAASIRADGLLQPIRVREDIRDRSRFIIIAGERRWRAAHRVPLVEIDAIVTDQRMDMERTRVEQAVENLQREDMNAVEEGVCYRSLLDAWQVSQAELARRLSKSAAHVSKMLAVFELDEETRQKIVAGEVSYGDALALRDQAAAAAGTSTARPTVRRRQRTLPRGTIPTPFGTVKLKRGAKLEELVGYLRTLVDQDKRDAA
jgi:ParB family transcriptional regulator, chromosome partitioning protein